MTGMLYLCYVRLCDLFSRTARTADIAGRVMSQWVTLPPLHQEIILLTGLRIVVCTTLDESPYEQAHTTLGYVCSVEGHCSAHWLNWNIGAHVLQRLLIIRTN